jgi:lantibiotic leader peptide-processing serine protease
VKKRIVVGAGLLLLAALALVGCDVFQPAGLVGSKSVVTQDGYILVFNRMPSAIDAAVAAFGGTVKTVLADINVVVAYGDSAFAENARAAKDVAAVIRDLEIEKAPAPKTAALDPEHIGSDEGYFRYQWDMTAINAPGAWNLGYTGEGARVAVIDTGIDTDHPDLAQNIDFAASASMVDGETIEDYDGHGSNVAGIIAAADNSRGVIGVAPNATIIAIKVFDAAGNGYFSWTIEGIAHAVAVDADIINMSLGAYVAHSDAPANEVAAFLNLLRDVINYATQQGVLVVCSAGNSALDGTGDAGLLHVPGDVGNGLVVSATGPVGWAPGSSVYLDNLASYSNYGSQVDFAAPGGDYQLYPNGTWYYDMVFNCVNGGYAWYAGTSQAAPHVCGVAALIVEKLGRDVNPAQIKAALRHSADDLGKPGQDPAYGYGRVNAGRAVAP